MEEIKLGQYALPYVIMVLLALAYKPFDNPDGTSGIKDWQKGYLAVAVGIAVGIVAMFYSNVAPTFKSYVDFILYGLEKGFAAVGVFKIAQFTSFVPITPPK